MSVEFLQRNAWTTVWQVDSHSSGKRYLVTEHKAEGWMCNCTAWAIKRNKIKAGTLPAGTDPDCKHITEVKSEVGHLDLDDYESQRGPEPIDEPEIEKALQSIQERLNSSKFGGNREG